RSAHASAAIARSVVAHPGSTPVKNAVLLPLAHAAAAGCPNSGGAAGGYAHGKVEIVTAFVPRSRKRHTSSADSTSRPMLSPKYDRQSASRSSTSSQSLVAITPVSGAPHNFPESTPTLSGDHTYWPTSSSSGWPRIPCSAAPPTAPVPQCTTR